MAVEARPLLRPLGILGGSAAVQAIDRKLARPLAGGPLAFLAVAVLRRPEGTVHALSDLPPELAPQLDALCRPRAPFAGLALDRPLIMGIVNATPDSFSDGGRHDSPEAAVRQGLTLLEAGADLLDVGGESTRPGAQPVPAEAQIARTQPVIAELSGRGAVVSIDTRDPAVMRVACAAGARIVNDVSALTAPGAIGAVREAGASAILVHMQGEPRSMQDDARYADVSAEVAEFLRNRIADSIAGGVSADRLAVDPGIGFGKRGVHNVQLLDEIAALHGLGLPVVLGASRKGWIGALDEARPDMRLGGSLAAALAGLDRGVQILRVHDVAETAQARLAWMRFNP